MANSSEFYRERAAQSASEAEAATLENVRDRSRRAEAAWLEMADKAEANEFGRAATAARSALKAEEVARAEKE